MNDKDILASLEEIEVTALPSDWIVKQGYIRDAIAEIKRLREIESISLTYFKNHASLYAKMYR